MNRNKLGKPVTDEQFAGPDMTAMQQRADDAAEFLKSMASKPRLLILCSLVQGPRMAGDLAAELGLAPANLSQHLSRLREEGLVASRREGNNMRYSLASDQVKPLIFALHQVFCGSAPE